MSIKETTDDVSGQVIRSNVSQLTSDPAKRRPAGIDDENVRHGVNGISKPQAARFEPSGVVGGGW